MNQLTQTASFIASEISSVENRERKRTASAQKHFEHAIECPSDIIDAIGGWTTIGVGQRYGTGQPLEVKAKWIDRLVDQD
jgi:hypothetical protein